MRGEGVLVIETPFKFFDFIFILWNLRVFRGLDPAPDLISLLIVLNDDPIIQLIFFIVWSCVVIGCFFLEIERTQTFLTPPNSVCTCFKSKARSSVFVVFSCMSYMFFVNCFIMN